MTKVVGATLLGMVLTGLAPGCVAAPEGPDATAVPRRKPPPAPAEPACASTSFAFDIDVPRVWLRGDFELDGAPPSGDPANTAIIELRSATLGVVELGALHDGGYGRWIIPGVYDVVYRHAAGADVPANAETVLATDVAFTATAVHDVAITSVPVSGAITIDGAPPPVGFYEQGVIRLRDPGTGAEFTIGRSLDGSYLANVLPGTYDVVWSRLAGGSLVPANADAILVEGVVIAGATVLDVDVPMVHRTGAFRLNGANPPGGFYENGELLLRDLHTGELVSLGETRDQTYSRQIVPGTYDLLYAKIAGQTMVPRNELAVVAKGLDLTTDGDLNLNIPMVTLRGSFSLDGAAFPQGLYDRGRMWLQGAEPTDTFELGLTNADYEIQVIPGTYDVIYQNVTANGLVPANPWAVVSTGHVIRKPKGGSPRPTVLDVAVSSGWLAADVTVWGAPPVSSFYQNAQVRGRNATGEPVVIGALHDGGGSVRALAGSYDLRYAHLIGDEVPANGDRTVGTAATQVAITPVALDLQPGMMSGELTQGGSPFPVLADAAATLSLRDVETGDQIVLGSTFDQAYQRYLLGGTYDVIYDHDAGPVVANRGAKLGCVTYTPFPPLGVGGGGFVQP